MKSRKTATYVNCDPTFTDGLSRMAFALLLPLMVLGNKENEIDKAYFTSTVGWIKDQRTWNKYWKELTDKNFLVQLDKKMWMFTPHQSYPDGESHSALITKWNEANNALS